VNYNDRMAAQLIADHERWTKREAAEIASRAKGSTTVDPYCRDRNITGEPSNKNRVYRASENSWRTMEKLKWSPVKVTAPDGTTTHAPVGAFRKSKGMAQDAQLHAVDIENRRVHRKSAADMASVQDYMNDN
jgi:hypothetical protein